MGFMDDTKDQLEGAAHKAKEAPGLDDQGGQGQ